MEDYVVLTIMETSGLIKTITNQMSSNHMIYQRAILGVIQPMIFKNSAYQGRLQNIRNLTHWACNGFNYGLIDDTGMTQYIDVGREIFIEMKQGITQTKCL